MRKKTRKIVLTRETLGRLELGSLAGGAEASIVADCGSYLCNSGRWEECDQPLTGQNPC